MSAYITAERLAEAVKRLSDSRAKPAMGDFLILKRAMVVGDDTAVKLSTRDDSFKSAINDIMSTTSTPDVAPARLPPVINVFGTARAENKGYRKGRYVTNGTAVTVPGWPIIEEIARDPRVVRFRENYIDSLPGIVLVKESKAVNKPRLDDVAMWFYRFTDLEVLGAGKVPTLEALLDTMVLDDLGLTWPEVHQLFETPEGWEMPDVRDEDSESGDSDDLELTEGQSEATSASDKLEFSE